MAVIKIGIAGVGYWGSKLLRCFASIADCKIEALCDNAPQKSAWEYDSFIDPADCMFTKSYADMLKHSEIEAVVIATPSPTHYAMTKAALEAGKHVLVEKPMCMLLTEAEELSQLATANNLITHVDHEFVYNSAVVKLKDILDDGAIGRVLCTISRRLNLGIVRAGESVVFSLLPHDVSILLYLGFLRGAGRVTAEGIQYPTNYFGFVSANIKEFTSGIMHCVSGAWHYPTKVRDTMIIGTKGFAIFDDTRPHAEKIRVINIDRSSYAVDCKISEPLMESCQEFVKCIQNNKQSRTNFEHGVQVAHLLEQIERACQAKRGPVCTYLL